MVILYRRFGTTYRSHLQGSRIPSLDFLALEDGTDTLSRNVAWTYLPLVLGPKRCPETSVKDYHSTLLNTPEKRTSRQWWMLGVVNWTLRSNKNWKIQKKIILKACLTGFRAKNKRPYGGFYMIRIHLSTYLGSDGYRQLTMCLEWSIEFNWVRSKYFVACVRSLYELAKKDTSFNVQVACS
jgi:hypothetical protein